jgi:peptidoglycan/LPS O-acetylase OafA/YrhL
MKRTSVIRFLPGLDGMRGLAVCLVVLFHYTAAYRRDLYVDGNPFGQALFLVGNVGWIGVDLFFTLSGFLITTILMRTVDTENYFSAFYLRRACRILPLYFGALCLVFVLLPLCVDLSHHEGYQKLSGNQGWLWSFLSNVPISFWDRSAFSAGDLSLAHFWSLAVEEQFYLVWPLAIRWTPAGRRLGLCLLLVLVAPALRGALLTLGASDNAVYSLMPCRMDCFAVGALVAVLRAEGLRGATSRHIARSVLVAGSLSILAMAFLDSGWHKQSFWIQTAGYSLVGVTAGALVFALTDPKPSPLQRVFESRPLPFLGRYSYGIYVWHLLFYGAFAKRLVTTAWLEPIVGGPVLAISVQIVVLSLLALAMAIASHHLLEERFLALKPRYVPGSSSGAQGRLGAVFR